MMPAIGASEARTARTSSTEAAPPEAITGMGTARAIASVAARLRPVSMPSRPMSVNTIAAAPASP